MKYRWPLLVVITVLLITSTATPISSDDNETAGNGSDTETPIISLQGHGLIGETWADIYWETNEPAIGGVEWGLTPQYGNVTQESGNYTMQHDIKISGLERDTDYYLLIFATDPDNNTGYFSFELGTYPKGRDTTPDYLGIMSMIAILALIIIIGVIYRLKRKNKVI